MDTMARVCMKSRTLFSWCSKGVLVVVFTSLRLLLVLEELEALWQG